MRRPMAPPVNGKSGSDGLARFGFPSRVAVRIDDVRPAWRVRGEHVQIVPGQIRNRPTLSRIPRDIPFVYGRGKEKLR